MLAKIKTITNLGSVVISVALVALQIIDIVSHRTKDTGETADGVKPTES